MINAEMRNYDYYTFGTMNGYGQPTLPSIPQGTVKMAIYTTSQGVQDNVNYANASYIGLTHDANISDNYVIQYGKKKLKVLYVQPKGRYKQAFLGDMAVDRAPSPVPH